MAEIRRPSDHLATVQRYLDALGRGMTPDALASFFTEDAVQEEFPNRLTPNGGRADVAAMRKAAERGQTSVAAQQYELLNVIADGDQVALEIRWTGTLAVPVGSILTGGRMSARCAIFLEFRDGKIARQRNYDCFDPF